ncbi:hypothetical protein AcW1_002629 [Taiwanofungus camphoratus]|nr:hypothetical protein AcV5_009688 [Antrodia cinnamomea]KAI0942858.1 hypothetical protein AcV7_002154 [Antrodia cinnamomea]KAI0943477.1 hypothetical protein AcW1_002629 [Antrodia cinnamomea]
MAFSPSHRSSVSVSNSNVHLAPPSPSNVKQRRMTSPSLPPPSPLNLPEPVYGHRRPPSPLRNGLTIDPDTGEVSDDGSIDPSEESREGRQWGQRSHSPTPSVAKFAANIAQRVGSLMSNMSPRSPSALPTDDELEAEAERERERSRREAERIMMQEAEDRRTVEERVLAMLQSNEASKTLPLPPSRSQPMPVTPPSPQSSQKDSSWWSIAKNKLTPTKEPLTPAQQIIQETKAREKELEKEKKRSGKMKQKSIEWPFTPESKFEDPAFIKMGLATITPPPPRPVSAAPSSPSPSPYHQGRSSIPPSLAASPLRSNDARSSSPSRAQPPLYAQFNAQGTLDIPGTLLTIVKRFEKLEKWTVGHVRALEERMDDVERWLVEKEKEKERSAGEPENGDAAGVEGVMDEMREELAELQGRVGELGREMAKLVTAPGNLSSGPSRNSAPIARAPSTNSSVAVRSISPHIMTSPRSTPPKVSGSTSPPMTTPVGASRGSRTRLPYPTGDYATPPDTVLLNQGAFSPPNSPPSSITSASKARHMSISGLPSQGTPPASSSPSGLPQTASPVSAASPPTLPPPSLPAARPSSISPTPRKRYTVALGGPIMSADRADRERPSTPHSRSQSREISTAFFSTSPLSMTPTHDDTTDESDSESGMNEETIGKAAARLSGFAVLHDTAASDSDRPTSTSPSGAISQRRTRPQSLYGPHSAKSIASPSPITPLSVRLRSHSTDRFGLGISDAGGNLFTPATPTSKKFVDPLVVRRQTKEELASTIPNPPKVMPGKPKVPVGELVAFFDQEKA